MKKKIRRNDPCPCGSKKKYKKCCGFNHPSAIPQEVIAQIQKKIKQEQLIKQKYGDVRPIISINHQGHKIVAVGNQINHSKNWKTVHDFLFDYIKQCLDPQWGTKELKKDLSEMHPILLMDVNYFFPLTTIIFPDV